MELGAIDLKGFVFDFEIKDGYALVCTSDGPINQFCSVDVRVPANPTRSDTPPADVEWLSARRVDMPIKCFEAKLSLKGGPLTLPRSYIYATRITPADTFGPFARETKNDPAWKYYEIDASHSPNVTAPEALMALLVKIAA